MIKVQKITTISELDSYVSLFKRSGWVRVFDTETTNLRMDAKLLIVSLYNGEIPPAAIFVHQEGIFEGVPIYYLREKLNELFSEGEWVAHNGKYDLWVCHHNRIKLPKLAHDTLLLIQMADTELLKNLEIRVKEDFGYDKPKFTKIVGKSWDKIDWYVATKPYSKQKKVKKETVTEYFEARINPDDFAQYAGEDSYWTAELLKKYLPIVQADKRSYKIYTDIEMPMIEVLLDMQIKGVLIDTGVLSEIELGVREKMLALKQNIFEHCKTEFNLNSSLQLAEVLYDRLKYPVLGVTPKGARSTDSSTMQALASKGYDVAVMLGEYSKLDKLMSAYLIAIPNLLDYDGKLRGSINSAGTASGRVSSSSPNLQNMPTSTEFPIRRAFVPNKNNIYVIFDMSQIEPRLLAEASQDSELIKIYNESGDIYQGIADMLGITRKQAKVVVLAIMYGLGVPNLAIRLKINEAEATKVIDNFYKRFSNVAQWKAKIENSGLLKGECRTLFGRKRTLISKSKNAIRLGVNAIKRIAVNSTIQGSAADLMKLTMIKLHRYFLDNYVVNGRQSACMLLQVHDEIVIECAVEDADKIMADVKVIVETAIKLSVPLICEIKKCQNWLDMKIETKPKTETTTKIKHLIYPLSITF